MKIGFLFNHDGTHQVPHTMPIAVALARRGVQVDVLTSSVQQREVARALAPSGLKIRFIDIGPGRISEALNQLLRHVAPYRRVAVLKANRALFEQFDALIAPETTTTLLRTRYRITSPKLVYVPHGAGDAAVGFQPPTRHFDLVLLSGDKVRRRMLSEGLVSAANSVVIGYPKFDNIDFQNRPKLFDNDLPTVLYNPHFNPRLSSWYDHGDAILDWFAGQSAFNLIFAPHVMLFKRTIQTSLVNRTTRVRPSVRARYRELPRVLIDTGSQRSIDMTYTRAADIYLGDVSSQIYEWCHRPRPAIFINVEAVQWQNDPNFAHWHLGEVIDGLAGLPAVLAEARRQPDRYAARQRQAFKETFHVSDESPAEKACDTILQFLEGKHTASSIHPISDNIGGQAGSLSQPRLHWAGS
jgi:hypothetical protein